MNKEVAGTIAGLLATIPMTAFMVAGHQVLPSAQRYPLPPRQITRKILVNLGVDKRVSEKQRLGLSVVNHLAFGAAGGAGYGRASEVLPGPPVVRGVLFGLGVWTSSYLGWLPASGLLKSATQQPAARNALMIGAHVVWGGLTGVVTHVLVSRKVRR